MKKKGMERHTEVGIVVGALVSVIVFGVAYIYMTIAVDMRVIVLSGIGPASQAGMQPQGNAAIALNLQQELNSSMQAGFTLNSTAFESSSAQSCSLQQISACNNNEPSQFVCVNSVYAARVRSQYSVLYNSSAYMCPEFTVPGVLGCAVQEGYCVVTVSNASV
jgi:hypothetical protein